MKLTISISDSDLKELEKLKQGNYLDMINYHSKKQIAVQSIKTIVFEEIRRNLRVWIQNIFSPFVTAFLYFLIFGYILGSKIGDLNGVPYVNFLVPGFLVIPVMGAAFGNGVFTTFMRKYFKTIQYIQSSPVNVHSFIIGITISGVLRGLIIALLIWLASVIFTGSFVVANPIMAIVVLILVCTIFSLAGMINAVYANTFEQINFIPTFILTPLTYLSGIFFDVNTLPTFFAKLSLFNPIAYVVSSFRYTFLGTPYTNLLGSVLFFIGIIIALYIYVTMILRKHLNIS
ncbi:ABC transporter permease [Psittacicella gerlachiana]|uniref:Transport permease protein n=1 Tax=Psittacicella gerlachiana TaxID=2028574 RepID=A0A3A1YAM3_9GAMM|nr:ABC transporter permease [Psittacicella gerlachiana]RIY34591.1 hypothetical protein CKF59_05335 [Psittacicella gerlachiana]